MDFVGKRLGHYQLRRMLGKGGWATVYLGEHVYLKSLAAVKVHHDTPNSEDLTNFLLEGHNLARLIHPHIIRLLDFSLEPSPPWMVMDYAPGGTLRQRHPVHTQLSMEQVVQYVEQITTALQYAHDRHLIHCDVKPSNMLVGEQGEILLSDFGIALFYPVSRSLSTLEEAQGTILYIAPEQLRRKPCYASDQYSLGIVVYEWLCGTCPFDGSVAWEIGEGHLYKQPPPLRTWRSDLPTEVEQIVLKALAKEPQQRFACVQDFATALKHAWH